jgi:hypothetical protein
MTDHCRSCRAPIRWATTANGRAMPVDLEPVPDGNLWLGRGPYGAVIASVVPEERREELAGELYLPHFATCPHAHKHRRRR